MVPATTSDRRSGAVGPVLTAANGSNIRTYGVRTISLVFNSRHYKWPCTIADVSQLLLGANFLRTLSLLIDVRRRRLVDAEDLTSIALRRTTTAAPHLGSIASANDDFARLLSEFPNTITPCFSQPTTKHGVEHYIPTQGPPLSSRAQ